MRPLLPILKEKKRYVVFESEQNHGSEEINSLIIEGLHDYIGDLGCAQAGMQLVTWNKKKRDDKDKP